MIAVPPLCHVRCYPKELAGFERFDMSVTEDHVKQPVMAVGLQGQPGEALRRLRVLLILWEIEMTCQKARTTDWPDGRRWELFQDDIAKGNHVTGRSDVRLPYGRDYARQRGWRLTVATISSGSFVRSQIGSGMKTESQICLISFDSDYRRVSVGGVSGNTWNASLDMTVLPCMRLDVT